jgi:hypothetical protein
MEARPPKTTRTDRLFCAVLLAAALAALPWERSPMFHSVSAEGPPIVVTHRHEPALRSTDADLEARVAQPKESGRGVKSFTSRAASGS